MPSIASLIVRIGAQDQEIQKALASVGEKARSLDVDLKKLGQSPLAGGAQKSLETLRATMDTITKAQQQVAERATLAAQGLEAMGGASRLTDTQLKQVNKTLQDGLSAFRALGKDAPDQLRSVAKSVSDLTPTLDFFDKKIIAIGAAIGNFLGNAATEAARALFEAGKEAFRYADTLENLSAATGIGVGALQDLEAIGVTSGVSIQTLATAVEQLQKHLDDPKAIQAIEKMGLNYGHIRSLAPENQFLEIAKAVSNVTDQVEKQNLGADVFGKTWNTIAPAIKGNIDELVSSMNKLTDAQVEAIDKAGDRFDLFVANNKRRLTGIIGDLLLAADQAKISWADIYGLNIASVARLPIAARDLKEQAKLGVTDAELGTQTPDELRRRLSGVIAPGATTPDFSKWAPDVALKAHIATVDRVAEAYAKMAAAVRGSDSAWERQIQLTHALANILPQLEGRTIGTGLGTAPSQISLTGGRQIGNGLGTAPTSVAGAAAADMAATATSKLDTMHKALSGVNEVLGGVQTKWAQMATVAVNGVQAVTDRLAKGDWVGAIVAAGAAVGNFVGKLFGISEESKKVSPLRDAFFKAAGGLDVLNPKVLQLTGNLKAVEDVFKAKTVDDYNAAIQRLNAILNTQDQAMASLNAAVQKYGFSIEELGPKFAQQNLNKQQGQLLEEWKLLSEAVSDHNALLTKTAGSFQDVVTAALKSGATISNELQGPIQDLTNMGLLVDENGNQLTDLSRLKFGSLDTEFQTLTKAINNLTKALGGAVDQVDELAKDRDFTVTAHLDTSDISNAPDVGFGIGQQGDFQSAEGFASGTGGFRNFGAGTPAVLHGMEAVVTPAQLTSLMRQRSTAKADTPPPIVIQITGPVLAATSYVEANLVQPILDGIRRYHKASFTRLVQSVVTP